MIPCRTHRPDERAILGNMGEDLGPLLPTGGWNFLILMVVVYIVPIGAVALATILGIARYRTSHARRRPTELAAVAPVPIERRLTEIDALLAAGRIDQDEHAALRSRILDLQ